VLVKSETGEWLRLDVATAALDEEGKAHSSSHTLSAWPHHRESPRERDFKDNRYLQLFTTRWRLMAQRNAQVPPPAAGQAAGLPMTSTDLFHIRHPARAIYYEFTPPEIARRQHAPFTSFEPNNL
jgi:hypothetical protein